MTVATETPAPLSLPELVGELRRRHGDAKGLSYQAVYRLVLDARIPARRVGRGWLVERGDVPVVAAALRIGS